MPTITNFGSPDKSPTGSAMPFPLAIPIITALGQGLQGYLQNKGQQNQQQQQQELLKVQQRRLQYERGQQLRDNARQDAQGSALNPVRANLYTALAQRLGLPAHSLAFGAPPAAAGAPRSAGPAPAMPGMDRFSQQAAGEQTYQDQMDAIAQIEETARRSPIPGVRDSGLRQAAALRQRLAASFGVGGQ